MREPAATRPDPGVTEDNEFYWEAAAEHRLVAQKCPSCGKLRHPPRPMCPYCNSVETEIVELSGFGTLYSYAILHHPQNPAFEYPIKAALVDLDEGIRMVSSLQGIDADAIEIGLRLKVAFVPTAGGHAVPVFEQASR